MTYSEAYTRGSNFIQDHGGVDEVEKEDVFDFLVDEFDCEHDLAVEVINDLFD